MASELTSISAGSDAPLLYTFWRSSCSWRVRIALAWKGIEYVSKPVHLVQNGGEHYKEEFTSLNPNQRVPALVIDGHVISQSGAILEYLEETRPGKALLPKDAYARAQVRNICLLIGADIQPMQNNSVVAKASELMPESEGTDKEAVWVAHWIQRGFVALEKMLATTAGKYCVGDNVTLADVYLQPQMYNAIRFSVDMSQFPIISRIAATLADLPEFKATHPSQQPDAP